MSGPGIAGYLRAFRVPQHWIGAVSQHLPRAAEKGFSALPRGGNDPPDMNAGLLILLAALAPVPSGIPPQFPQ